MAFLVASIDLHIHLTVLAVLEWRVAGNGIPPTVVPRHPVFGFPERRHGLLHGVPNPSGVHLERNDDVGIGILEPLNVVERVVAAIQNGGKNLQIISDFLKCDVRKFFDSIDHDLLKQRLETIVDDKRTLTLLFHIIDSYEVTPGRGIPMGNQTSQWFALFYLDPLDRLVKEKLRIKYYTRYMDDCILLHHSKQVLEEALAVMRLLLDELHLEFNDKTQIFRNRSIIPRPDEPYESCDTYP